MNEELKKFKKKKWGGGLGRGGGRVGGQGGCERRIEVFGKIHKKKIGGGGSVTKGVRWWGSGRWGWGQGGCERNVGVGGDVGYGGC